MLKTRKKLNKFGIYILLLSFIGVIFLDVVTTQIRQ